MDHNCKELYSRIDRLELELGDVKTDVGELYKVSHQRSIREAESRKDSKHILEKLENLSEGNRELNEKFDLLRTEREDELKLKHQLIEDNAFQNKRIIVNTIISGIVGYFIKSLLS